MGRVSILWIHRHTISKSSTDIITTDLCNTFHIGTGSVPRTEALPLQTGQTHQCQHHHYREGEDGGGSSHQERTNGPRKQRVVEDQEEDQRQGQPRLLHSGGGCGIGGLRVADVSLCLG